MVTLSETLLNIVRFSEEELEQATAAFRPLHVPKKQHWLQEGSYCNHIAFVQSGRLRMYYSGGNGEEVTCFFVEEGSFAAAYGSFLTRTPSRETLVAMEDTELLLIERGRLEELSAAIPALQVFRRVMAEQLFLFLEDRIRALQTQPADIRYDTFMQEHPEWLLSIPLQQTASFLGISPQHLSRLRRKKIG